MEVSQFLARWLGIYLLVVSVLWCLRRQALARTLDEFFASRAQVFLSGLLALAVGIAMVLVHSVWEWNWRGVITVLGYLSIAKGITRIGFPEVPRMAVASLAKGARLWGWIGLMFVLGGFLAWVGFTT